MGVKERGRKARLWFQDKWTRRDYGVPGGYGESVAKYSGARGLKNIFLAIVKPLIVIISVLLVVFVIAAAGIFITRSISTGYGDTVTTNVGVFLDKVPFGQAVKTGFAKTFGIIWNPAQLETDYGWKTEVEKNRQYSQLGVKVENFKILNDKILSGQEINARGEVKVSNLGDEEVEVFFSCETDDENDGFGEVTPENIFLNRDQIFGIGCVYSQMDGDFSGAKIIDTKQLKLNTKYEYTTRGFLDFYTMSKSSFEDEIDVFKDMNNPYLGEDKRVTSTYTEGPIKLALKIPYTQPLTEEGPFVNTFESYTLGIKLTKKLIWSGEHGDLNNLYLFIPEDIIQIEDDRFFKTDHFFVDENDLPISFSIYTLKEEEIAKLNNVCDDIIQSVYEKQCRDQWDKGFQEIYVEFFVVQADDNLRLSYIGARVDYDYISETSDTFTVRERT
ncbi:hypothetical protein K8R47_01385 [archaeon]|nr:hypothetical protein [archaeon]